MVDADIAGDARAHRELALDGAAWWGRQLVRKQHPANLLVAVGTAGGAQERAILLAGAELLRCNKTALPDAGRGRLGVSRRRLDVGLDRLARDGKAEFDQLLVQADLVALGRADCPVPFAKVLFGPDVVAAHGAFADQL